MGLYTVVACEQVLKSGHIVSGNCRENLPIASCQDSTMNLVSQQLPDSLGPITFLQNDRASLHRATEFKSQNRVPNPATVKEYRTHPFCQSQEPFRIFTPREYREQSIRIRGARF